MKFFVFINLAMSIVSLSAFTAGKITKTYFVKGMHCGGCESGVRASLIELGGVPDMAIKKVDHKAVDAEAQIGTVVIEFDSDNYEGKKTDCRLAKAIKKNPGYQLYWEKNNMNPCNL